MTEKELACQGCDDSFKDGVQRMVGVLLQEYVAAKTPAEKRKAAERFQAGLEVCKETYQSAQQAINTVFT